MDGLCGCANLWVFSLSQTSFTKKVNGNWSQKACQRKLMSVFCSPATRPPDPADGGGGGLGDVLHDPLAGDRWGAGLPAVRLPDVLGLPAAQWGAALPLLGLPARLQSDIGYPVRLPQAGDPRLSGGGRDLLRRGQGQGGARAVARSRRPVQDCLPAGPQDP